MPTTPAQRAHGGSRDRTSFDSTVCTWCTQHLELAHARDAAIPVCAWRWAVGDPNIWFRVVAQVACKPPLCKRSAALNRYLNHIGGVGLAGAVPILGAFAYPTFAGWDPSDPRIAKRVHVALKLAALTGSLAAAHTIYTSDPTKQSYLSYQNELLHGAAEAGLTAAFGSQDPNSIFQDFKTAAINFVIKQQNSWKTKDSVYSNDQQRIYTNNARTCKKCLENMEGTNTPLDKFIKAWETAKSLTPRPDNK